MEKLINNINYEWERYYLDMMRKSREGIFSRAKEIVRMQEIKDFLLEQLDDLKPEQIEQLKLRENILDEIYRYVLDYAKPRKTMEELILTFINR